MHNMTKAQAFCKEVAQLAKKYDLPFFLVTDGASITSNNGCEAVKVARENHKKWEQAHGIDSNHDWSKQTS